MAFMELEMMQYRLATGAYAVILDDIKEMIKDGWKPQGGIGITCFKDEYDDVEYRYAQAMVKDDDE